MLWVPYPMVEYSTHLDIKVQNIQRLMMIPGTLLEWQLRFFVMMDTTDGEAWSELVGIIGHGIKALHDVKKVIKFIWMLPENFVNSKWNETVQFLLCKNIYEIDHMMRSPPLSFYHHFCNFKQCQLIMNLF